MHVGVGKVQYRFTWKCLEGCRRSLLKLLSEFVGYEQVMYIALVREEIGVVRADWSILVILDLLESASATFQNFGFTAYRLLKGVRALKESRAA